MPLLRNHCFGFNQSLNGGSIVAYRIRRAPEGRRDLPRYYAQAGGKLHWTTFRDIAKDFSSEQEVINIVKRIIHSNGKLQNKISVEPC